MNPALNISELLDLAIAPVAVTFQEEAPAGVQRISESAVSSCTYWKLAAAGQHFYTDAVDHHGCPIGAHTHGIDLPPEKADELNSLVSTMVELEYLSPDEVPDIPRRKQSFGVATYQPAKDASTTPDALLVRGNAKQIMLLAEAAHAAGVSTDSSMVGRPTCAVIPAVIESGGAHTNLGCIGNRVYTEMPDDELYFVAAGAKIESISEHLATIVNANNELDKFHAGRAGRDVGTS